MHANEVHTDADLVRRLLATQFPHWADLPIEPVPSAGTDNALYRLGDDMAVRLPRIGWAVGQVEKEVRWLPLLAPYLPLDIPVPLATGEPAEGYPWRWGVYRWLDGEPATVDRVSDPRQAAVDLAGFVVALQRIDTTGGPRPGEGNSSRGVPLASRDAETRKCIEELRDLGMIDADTAIAVWEDALSAPVWDAPPVWIHGDLQSGNMLAREGRLSAVIDFGCLGVGDPACDVMPAWIYLTGQIRSTFRAALGVDSATWRRGRGWALSFAVVALPYYYETNPGLSAIARYAITESLSDFAENG
jgi:aminoglycoside phosphotransferase (APT) family kinase protein